MERSTTASLHHLIDSLVEEAVLLHPQFDEPFIVDTDASDQGLGAVCSQVRNGVEHPVAFASRRLLPAESKWHIREKEALGIVWALETFRHYLLGSQFSVRTDHSSLQWLREAKTGRLCRWALRLAEFGDFPIVHRSGKVHSNVDAFTRSFAESEEFPEKAFCGAAQERIIILMLFRLSRNSWRRKVSASGVKKQRMRSLGTQRDISQSRMASLASLAAGFVLYSPIRWSSQSFAPFTKPLIMRTSARGGLTRNSRSYSYFEVEFKKSLKSYNVVSSANSASLLFSFMGNSLPFPHLDLSIRSLLISADPM